MCGGRRGGGRHRLREPLEPAQPGRVVGVFVSPRETGVVVADSVVSGWKGQWVQGGIYSEDFRGQHRPEGEG